MRTAAERDGDNTERQREMVRTDADADADADTDADTDADGGDRNRWWWRPLLYANVTQRWFEDKKNWETTRLFTDADHAAIAREAAAQSEQ